MASTGSSSQDKCDLCRASSRDVQTWNAAARGKFPTLSPLALHTSECPCFKCMWSGAETISELKSMCLNFRDGIPMRTSTIHPSSVTSLRCGEVSVHLLVTGYAIRNIPAVGLMELSCAVPAWHASPRRPPSRGTHSKMCSVLFDTEMPRTSLC